MAYLTSKCPHRGNNGSNVLWVPWKGNPIFMFVPEDDNSRMTILLHYVIQTRESADG